MQSSNFHGIIDLLESKNAKERYDGWSSVQAKYGLGGAVIPPHEFKQLQEILLEELDELVRLHGNTVLLSVIYNACQQTVRTVPAEPAAAVKHETKSPARKRTGEVISLPSDGERQAGSLWAWLWEPFCKPSFVFGLSDPNYRGRDQDALYALRGLLSDKEFPNADFQTVDITKPEIDPILATHEYNAICWVGRLNMYGDAALARWASDTVRLGFPDTDRPDLKAGQLDPVYHRMFDRVGLKSVPLEYRCVDDENSAKRTDYALLQRYVCWDNHRYCVVLKVAGVSSLGTHAGAIWSAKTLKNAIHPDGSVIPAPPWITTTSCLEVLLKIEAPLTDGRWNPQTDVVRIRCDDHVWSFQDRKWRVDGPREIVLVFDSREQFAPSKLFFDGVEKRLKSKSVALRLIVALCMAAPQDAGRVVPLEQLRKDHRIWGNKTPDVKRLLKHLQTVKERYLEPLTFDEKVATLGKSVAVYLECGLT